MDHRPASSDHPPDMLSENTIHDMQSSLTVIKGQAQLLKRWIERNESHDDEVVTARLKAIDDTVTRLAMRIEGMREDAGDHQGAANGTCCS